MKKNVALCGVSTVVLTTFLKTKFFGLCWLPCLENYTRDISLLVGCSHLLNILG